MSIETDRLRTETFTGGALPARPFVDNRQAQEAKQQAVRQSTAVEDQRRANEEKSPRPVTNGLGQVTGSLINVIA